MANYLRDEKLLCKPEKKADLEIANQSDVLEFLEYFVDQGRTRITEADVLKIHELTIKGIYPCAGLYRDATKEITITGTSHCVSHPAMVRSDVHDALEWHYGPQGQAVTPIDRAARIMWKICAIHPFSGGNGRVARAVAYLTIVSEIAPLFAGEPFPAKLKKQKPRYLKALQAADRGDLKPMSDLVLECMGEQLSEAILEVANGLKEPSKQTQSQKRLLVFFGSLLRKLFDAFVSKK
jgi:fido (protein-threonine AMPylation protein)